MNRKLILLIIIIIISVSGYTAFKLLDGKEKSQANKVSKALTVSVVLPYEQTLLQRVSATGILLPREEITVLTELSNVRVKQILVDVGDRVKKGQKLAVLDGESLELQARQLDADYQKVRDEYMRIQPIKDTGAVSQLSVIEKLSAMEAAKARMEDAKLNLRRLTITAPETGVIYERRAKLGNLVNSNEPLFLIAQGNEIEASLRIPEAEISKIRIKQPVTLSVTGSTQEWKGTVRLISPRIDATNRTAQVRVSITNKDTLIVGSFVQAEISTHNKSGLALPATAIQEDSEGNFVWMVNKENKPIRQAITLLARQDNVALVQGIKPSMRIIAKAGAFIKAGDTVNPTEEK